MDPESHLAQLTEDSSALVDAAAPNLERPVAACPGWTVADLVGHLGGVYGWTAAAIAAAGAPPETRPAPPEDRSHLMAWFGDRRAEMLAALAAPPAQEAWNFSTAGSRDVAWWRRRQAMETAVHRFDVEQAIGRTSEIPAQVASDGIDELLTVMLGRVLARRPVDALRGTFHVHATDTPGEWLLDFSAPDLAVRREHGKGDTAARGPAAGLFLWLWNRTDPASAGIEVFGDGALVGAWREVRP